MIAALVMWLAMAGQGRMTIQQPCTSMSIQDGGGPYAEIVGEPKGCYWPDGSLSPIEITPKPSEHVIEIRTKRTTRNVLLWHCPTNDNGFYCGHQIPPVVKCKSDELYRGDTRSDNTVTQQCVRVTKTLYIDGQRVGVIRETEEK